MPAFKNHNATAGVPRTMVPGQPVAFRDGASPIWPERNYTISGVTKDSGGTALGNCAVKLFNSATNALEQQTTSDASGNYSFQASKTAAWFVVAYKAGSPDVAGTTVNTVSAV